MAAEYQLVCRHLSWWRGEVHKWSTVWPLVSTAEGVSWTIYLQDQLATVDSQICYFGPDGGEGHLYQADFYSKDLGGMPILTTTYGSDTVPSDGSLPSGGAYVSSTAIMQTPLETCLIVDFSAGLSKSGKPVQFRKYFHAVPQSTATDGAPDISPADRAAVNALAASVNSVIAGSNLLHGNARRLAGDPYVSQWYGNHQMPRGRRRKKIVTSSYAPGDYVVVSPPSD